MRETDWGKERERDWCIENLLKVSKIADDCGIIVGVEPLNRFETDMINTADQALSLVKEVNHPNIKVSLDTFHCNIEEKSMRHRKKFIVAIDKTTENSISKDRANYFYQDFLAIYNSHPSPKLREERASKLFKLFSKRPNENELA